MCKTIKTFFIISLFSFLVIPAFSLGGDTTEEGLEYLLFEEIPEIITASKTSQSVNRATSVVTVITEKDMARSGARTLYEVLKRVPGFFPSVQASWTQMTSRGISADSTDHLLLLIDGHQQNSILGQGYQQQDMLPTLDKVKQIEIIRGPGSVLWGSSAVWGIINIITKDGATDRMQKASVAYGDGDGMESYSYLTTFGIEEKTNAMVSFTYWKSKGYDRPDKTGPGNAWSKADAQNIEGNIEFPWGEIGDWPPIDQHREGYELYGKVNMGENKLIGRVVESNVTYPWDTWMESAGSDLMMRKAYLEYKNTHPFSDTITLESTVYGDYLLQNRFPTEGTFFKPNTSKTIMQDQTNEEMAFGLEFLGTFKLSDTQNLRAGLKGVRTKIGPNRDARFDIYQNYPYDADPSSGAGLPYLGVESGYDNNYAVYSEWLGSFDKFDLFLGGRYDKNDFREDKGIVLPRGGVIFNITEDLTLKGVYNTGYLRPAAVYSKTVGKIVDTTRGPTQDILRVTDSEKISSIDVQLFWKKEKNHFAVNLYIMNIEDYISFDANNTPQGYKNLGEVTTKGVELEARTQLGSKFSVYGNYSYALGKLDESRHQGAITNDSDETLNYPKHILNLGIDCLFTDTTSLNVNLNAWRDMNVVLPLGEANTYGEFDKLDGEQYIDINLTANQVFGSPCDLSLFCFNILDNTEPIGLVVNNGFYHPRGRNLGAKISLYW
ncbi:MAG: TonB-dependent receptor [Candidatus Aureabacteria bacterium]|nr:TonB-dependent receptor [Candidatus Auribacterota bacterium]